MARVALVTGGSRGIGAAISACYAGNAGAAWSFQDQAGIPVFQWDVANFQACAAGIREVEAALGPIDILVNNAGIVRDATLHRMTKQQWDAVIRADLDSLFNMCRPLIEGMRARKFGRIINISSINGQKGQIGQTNYAAAKAAELGFTRALALESARFGITVNAICPGYINTEMLAAVPTDVMQNSILPQIPVGRLGQPEEIARAVAFLAADEAGFITGSTLSINGGQHMC
jgi:acetoacetyl-CoA reductase